MLTRVGQILWTVIHFWSSFTILLIFVTTLIQ